MFDYLFGTLIEASPEKAIIDVGGLGYLLLIPISTFEKLPNRGASLKIYVSLVIREDSHRLFGFLEKDARNTFELLNEISGIGPRISLSLLGHMSLQDLRLAVEHANTKAISKVPGIGKKMAERLILELKDKFGKLGPENISLSSKSAQGIVSDAISALINLGYNPLEAQKAVKSALPEGNEPPLSELISMALKGKK